MKEFIIRDGKKLRLGYTTGSCAAAAAKAAAWMLLSGSKKESIRLLTPKGMELTLAVEDICLSPDCVRCAIRKDSGDDPDITRDTLIYAEVRKTETVGIVIDGGQGVGRVTKPGLDQPVGAAAINSVPRLMIREAVEEVCGLFGYTGGMYVVISAPDGETLAKKTFNPRLGIEGGISILGTTGIVEPMSEQALVENTHEPLVSQELWEIVREVRRHKRRAPKHMEEPGLFSGLVYCADCGAKLSGSSQQTVCGSSCESSHVLIHCKSPSVRSTVSRAPERSKLKMACERTGSIGSRTMRLSVLADTFQWISRIESPGR